MTENVLKKWTKECTNCGVPGRDGENSFILKYFCGGGARPYFRVHPGLAGTRSGAGVMRDLDICGRLECSFGECGP